MSPFFLFLALLASVGDSPLPVRQQIGVNIHFTGAPERDLDLIAEAGFGWVRMDLFWKRVERQRGEYLFAPYDQLLDGLDSRGIRALFILDYSNPLYEDGHSVRSQAGREAFARFAAVAAERYRGRGIRWEIWNEPNLEPYWSPQPSAKDYIELVRITAAAIRAADPEATIVAPATSRLPWDFLEQLFEAGVLDLIDEVSVHPYRETPPETATSDYERLRRMIAEHAVSRSLPLISSEWGYSTAGSGRVSPELQARYLARQFLTNLAAGVELSIWYDWINDGPDPKDREHHYGTVQRDHRPKPAFAAARALSSALGDAHFVRRLAAGRDDHVLLFAKPDKTLVVAAWTQGAPHDVLLEGNLEAGSRRVTDVLGNPGRLDAQDGAVGLPLSDAPIYLTLPEGTTADTLIVHSIELLPLADRVVVDVRRGGAGKAAGQLNVKVGRKSARESVTLDAAKTARADLPVRWRAKRPRTVSAYVSGPGGRTLASSRTVAYALPDPFRDWGRGPNTEATPLAARLDGDAKVGGTAEVSEGPPAESKALPLGRTVRLRYRFDEGWKFVRVVAAGSGGEDRIRGRPRALSVWVRGDASDAALRCRFRDATGETFQPDGGAVSWDGWQRVVLPLDGTSASFWGGDGDGEVDYPITWDSLLLLDPSPRGGEGDVLFASPLLVYDAS